MIGWKLPMRDCVEGAFLKMIEEVPRRCQLKIGLSDGADAAWILRYRHGCAFAFRCSSARVSIHECELICARQACVEGLHAWRPLRASCRRLLGVFWSSHVCSVSRSGDHCLIAATAPAVTAPETTVIVALAPVAKCIPPPPGSATGSRVRAPAPAVTCRTLATRGIPAHACVACCLLRSATVVEGTMELISARVVRPSLACWLRLVARFNIY